MNLKQQAHFDYLYQQHLSNLTLQGKRPATIDAYSRALRRISAYFDCPPDILTTQDLKQYFSMNVVRVSQIAKHKDNGDHSVKEKQSQNKK